MASTSYNTPQSATKMGGWFSKLIDPAARFIVSTASHLFSSSSAGKNVSSNEEIPQANSAPQFREQREEFVDIKLSFHYNGTIMSEQELSSHFDDIFQLEHLIYQKCFTKEEIDRLDILIHSKIVEPLEGNQNKEKTNGDSNANSKDNLDCSKPPKEPPSTLGLNAAMSLPTSPTNFASKDLIQRPYCRSALCRRTPRSSCKDKNTDLKLSLKWCSPSKFNTSLGHQQGLKRSRSDWDAIRFDGEQRRIRQKLFVSKVF